MAQASGPVQQSGKEQASTPMSTHAEHRTLSDRAAAGYAIGVALFLAYVTYAALWHHYAIPHIDDWRILDKLHSSNLLDWIYAGKSGHRIPVTYFLIFIDYKFLGGQMHLPVFASIACLWMAAIALYFMLRKRKIRGNLAGLGFAFSCFALFWAAGRHDLAWGTNQGTLQTTMLLFGVIAVLVTGRDSGHPPHRAPVLAGLGAGLATFSHGMGCVVWVAAIAIAVADRIPWKATLCLVAGAIASVWIYSIGLAGPWDRHDGWYLFLVRSQPLELARFVVQFIGAPVAAVASALSPALSDRLPDVAALAGTVGALGFATHAALLISRSCRLDSRDLVALGLMTFSIGVAFVVSLNRVGFEGAALSSRFSTASTIFWIGAIQVIASACGRRPWSARQRLAGVILVVLMSGAMLPAFSDSHRRQQRTRASHERSSTMHLVDVQWDVLAHDGHMPDPARVYRVVSHLRTERLSFFDGGRADLVGARLGSRFTPTRRCSGAVKRVEPLPTRGRPGARMLGTAWDRIADRPADGIVITDSGEIIRGLGVVLPAPRGRSDRSVFDFLRFSRAPSARWEGFVGGYDGSENYTVYAIFSDRDACPLRERSRRSRTIQNDPRGWE